ncbi:MAG: DUF1223 domain-containing protein [Proteobacteria bacterium]|nr:DUF1223 domain-containing protein [Pseudomonadota bacterium]
MMRTFKFYLIIPVVLGYLFAFQGFSAAAQEALTTPVDPLSPESAVPIVVELFSSQACVFCPRADRLFADLAQQRNVIGLACHVDYFDVRQGALSRPFCTQRQTWYQAILRGGPNYTPQMVMQGSIDAVGYKMDKVAAGMKEAAQMKTAPLYIFATGREHEYRVALPENFEVTEKNAVLWFAATDTPHDVTIAEGRNKGQKVTYYNIVSAMENLGAWPEGQQGTAVKAFLNVMQEGFALLLQDSKTGKIMAAGKYKKELPASAPPPN